MKIGARQTKHDWLFKQWPKHLFILETITAIVILAWMA